VNGVTCHAAGKERTKRLVKNVAVTPSPLLMSLLQYLSNVGIASYPLDKNGEEFVDEVGSTPVVHSDHGYECVTKSWEIGSR
jgi:hypothetical protein